ncbi:MAG: FtsX-like permease family protein [Deltaproteobacteria bacterium]|nr:FtsX-like permease family protein [Deltaproteobacteria bacterium]
MFYSALLRTAWRNVFRNSRRTALTALSVGVAVAFVWTLTALMGGMMDRSKKNLTDGWLGNVQVHLFKDKVSQPFAQEVLTTLLDKKVAAAGRIFGPGMLQTKDAPMTVTLIGLHASEERSSSHMEKKIQAGRFFDAPKKTPTTQENFAEMGCVQDKACSLAVLGKPLFEALNAKMGDVLEVQIGGALEPKLYIVGTFATGAKSVDIATIWLQRDKLQTWVGLEGRLHEISVHHEGSEDNIPSTIQDLETLRSNISAMASPLSPEKLSVQHWREVVPQAAVMFDMTESIFAMFAMVIFLVVGSAVLLTQSMVAHERRREFGVLRSIGMEPAGLLFMLTAESALVAALGALLGLVGGGILLTIWSQTGLNLSSEDSIEVSGMIMHYLVYPQIEVKHPVQAAVITIGIAAFTSLVASFRIAFAPPLEGANS